ncbi:MAG: esterase-like activity of phytase family protein [Hyphomicrobium sp.]
MLEDIAKSAAALLRQILALLASGPTTGDTSAEVSGRVTIMEIAPGTGPTWGTLSGLAAHPTDPGRIFAITDQDSAPIRIIEIAVTAASAVAIAQIRIVAPGLDGLDTEAIAAKPDGGFWLASEGAKGNVPPNLLIEVDAAGRMLRTLALPASIAARMPKKGFEGVALQSTASGAQLVVAFQAPLDGDPDDMTRVGVVDPASGAWRFYYYPLDRNDDGDITGLSEVLALGQGRFAAIERDGKGGKKSIKWITTFALSPNSGAAPDATPPVLDKHVAIDLVPIFRDAGRKVEKEVEGLAVAADGMVYVVTDNDGERPTLLIRLGPASEVF